MLSQTKFYNKYKEEIVGGLVWGILWGLVLGLVWGIVWGLVLGLVLGLVVGIVWGLVWGIVWGLVWGIVWGLVVLLINFKEAFPFLVGVYPILLLVLGVIIISEILFFLMPKEKLKKGTNLFWHTCKRKFENIFEVLLGLSGIGQVYVLLRELKINITPEIWQGILRWIGYVGTGIVLLGLVVLIFYIWIKLNTLKYRNV